MDTTRMKITQFRIACKPAVPYLAHSVYGLIPVERPGIKTMAVDRYRRLYYDPKYVESISTNTGVFTVLHEMLHVELGHCELAQKYLPPRPTPRQLYLWNMAADMVVNQLLAHWLPFAPPGVVNYRDYGFPAKQSVVQYYEMLLARDEQEKDEPEDEENDDDEEQDAGEDGGDDGEEERDEQGDSGAGESDDESGDDDSTAESGGEGDDDSEGDDHGESGADGDGDGDDAGAGSGDDGEEDREAGGGGGGDEDEAEGQADGARDGDGGSGADGFPRSYELPPDPAYADREYACEKELEAAILEQEASFPGTVPAELKDAVDLKLRPQADPFDVLKGLVAKAIAAPGGLIDFTLRRPSRRQFDPTGPRRYAIKKEMPDVVVLLDTSGSMQLRRESELKAKALGVIAKAVSKMRSVKVYCGDTDLHNRQIVQSIGKMRIEGGGGTDMGRLIERIEREDRPAAIIVVTDTETGWCEKKPRAKVVIAAVKDSTARYPVPSWAKFVDVSKGGR
jgi:predicted metal-dependent peptidase